MSAVASETPLRERVFAALATVYDPELDEPVTSLRFVSACDVSDEGDVAVSLRLPTPQCAPNFAFLMAADARRAVRALAGVRDVQVRLEDHYTGDEINKALADGGGFTAAFPGETGDDDLESLRVLFTRKALIARQGAVCEAMLAGGAAAEEVAAALVADLPASANARRCIELREQLDMDAGCGAAAFVLASGEPLTVEQLPRWLRMSRLVRTGLETNGGICRSLLRVRHGLAPEPEEVVT
jgi:metal-sulfur cluster biosynthetic enzyme